MTLNPAIGPALVRIYLVVATVGAVMAVPVFGMFAWWAMGSVRSSGPTDWVSWAIYLLIAAVFVLGPVIGWRLFRKGRLVSAMVASFLAFLLLPILVAGWLAG